MEEIKIYTNETCNFCKELKTSLDEKDVKYTNINTSNNKEEWQKVVDITFIPTVPTVLYKDTYCVAGRDFNNAQQCAGALKHFADPDYIAPSLEVQTLESIKNLNAQLNKLFQIYRVHDH